MGSAGTSPIAGGRDDLPSRPATASSKAPSTNTVTSTAITTRLALVFVVLAALMEAGSLVFYSAAAGFSSRLSVPPIVLLASGPNGAKLLLWGSIVDLLGYLCIAPVVLYLRDRFASVAFINLYAVAGIGVVVIGSIGAVVMLTAAPYLIDQYHSASSVAKPSIELVFSVVYRAVVLGMWQTLEATLGAVWLIGTAVAARRQGARAVCLIMLVIGVAYGCLALYRVVNL